MTGQRAKTKHMGTDDKGTFNKDIARHDDCETL